MFRILIGLLVLGSAAAANADDAGLPTFDIQAICSHADVFGPFYGPPMSDKQLAEMVESLKPGCIQIQQEMKKELEAQHLDAALVRYCAADADFHGKGYMSMMSCRARVQNEAQFERLKKAFGDSSAQQFCDNKYPGSSGAYSACQYREERARLKLQIGIGLSDDDAFDRCTAKSVASGTGYDDLLHCLSAPSSASR